MAAGVLLILSGLVIGVGGTSMLAAGCGYVGSCKVSTVEQFVSFAIDVSVTTQMSLASTSFTVTQTGAVLEGIL
jgi:hypothetical protein